MMSIEPGVVDANILAYAINADAPQHRASRMSLETARTPDGKLYITPQILSEFYSVVTNPKRVLKPCSPLDATQILEALLVLPGLQILPISTQAVVRLLELLRSHPVTGGAVFDLQIVATMQAHSVNLIYTFNVGDFQRFPGLTVVSPEA